jgi:coenzyme Q-binding protein COQ10
MPKCSEIKILPYSALQMYELVMNIESYPQFLPWCKQARIIQKISDKNLQAELLINFKNFFEKYTSDVFFDKVDEVFLIDVVAIKGPFKTLVNKWKFREISDQKCEVEFFLEFEFNSFFLNKMIGQIFVKATEKMMTAFEQRAFDLYTKPQ